MTLMCIQRNENTRCYVIYQFELRPYSYEFAHLKEEYETLEAARAVLAQALPELRLLKVSPDGEIWG